MSLHSTKRTGFGVRKVALLLLNAPYVFSQSACSRRAYGLLVPRVSTLKEAQTFCSSKYPIPAVTSTAGPIQSVTVTNTVLAPTQITTQTSTATVQVTVLVTLPRKETVCLMHIVLSHSMAETDHHIDDNRDWLILSIVHYGDGHH